jgi:hypothetical protein
MHPISFLLLWSALVVAQAVLALVAAVKEPLGGFRPQHALAVSVAASVPFVVALLILWPVVAVTQPSPTVLALWPLSWLLLYFVAPVSVLFVVGAALWPPYFRVGMPEFLSRTIAVPAAFAGCYAVFTFTPSV